MKKATLLSLILSIACSVQGQDNPELTIQHLTDNFYVFTTYGDAGDGTMFPSNSMYLVTDEGVVLFDTPWDRGQLLPLLDTIQARHGKRVIMAIATHFHDDSTAGLEKLKQMGIKTYSSRMTYELCQQENNDKAEFFFWNDTTFHVGGYNIEAFYPGEGHTKDNIVLWVDAHKVLYGGCLIKSTENTSLGFVGDANLQEWPRTMQRLIAKYSKPKYVIPGHFGWENNDGLEHTLKLLQEHK